MKTQLLQAFPEKTSSDAAGDLLSRLLHSLPDVVCATDAQGCFLAVNAAAERLWGYTAEELTGTRYIDLVVPEDRVSTVAVARQIIGGRAVSNFENRYIRKDGSIISLDWSAVWDEDKGVMYSVARDAGERLKAQQEVQQAKGKIAEQTIAFNEMIESMQDGFFALDHEWQFTHFNKEAELLTGQSRENLIGKVFWEAFPSARNTIIEESYRRAVRDQVQVSYEFRSQLYHHWYDVTAYPCSTGLSVFFRNTTERKRQEEALRRSHERYEQILKATSDILWDWDLVTNEGAISAAFTDKFGHKLEDGRLFELWAKYLHPEDKERVLEASERAINDPGTEQFQIEYRLLCKDGSLAYVLDRGFIVRDGAGKALRVTGAIQDITGQKTYERSILLSEEKYRKLFYNSPVPKWSCEGGSLRITHVNDAACALYGYTEDEFLAMTVYDLAADTPEPQELAECRALLSEPDARFSKVVAHRKKSGDVFQISLHGFGMLEEGMPRIVLIGVDVTELLSLQQRLIEQSVQAQRDLTRAILQTQESERSEIGKELHDNVNQVLTTIKLYLENLHHAPGQAEALTRKVIQLTDRAISEIRNLSHQLVTPIMKDFGFRDSIDELLSLYRRVGLFDIQLQFTVCEHKMDEEICLTIYRIIQEALNNAVKYADATQVSVSVLFEDSLVKVIVADNGVGFDPGAVKTGLGLRNIKNRASIYGGLVSVESEPHGGCRLQVFFPTIDDEIVRASS